MDKRKISSIFHQEVRRAVAKSRPNTLFEQAFYDIRKEVKEQKSKLEEKQKAKLQSQLVNDLRSRGVTVMDAKLSLGRYRGSSFVTSFKLKIKVKSEKEADSIATYLRGKYSPKWKVKKVADGVADLNVR